MAFLIIKSVPNIAFYSGDDEPDVDITFNSLVSFSRLHKTLRVNGGENGTLTVQVRPVEIPANILRSPAEFYIDDRLVFRGVVSRLYTGVNLSITLQEAAGHLKYTDTLPLRSTGDLGVYTVDKSLPVVYGQAKVTPFDYNGEGHLWFVADHNIQGINSVKVDGKEISAYSLRREFEGHAITVLETQKQYDSSAQIVVALNGKMHPTTGALMDTASVIIWDFLSDVCGLSVTESDLDALRSEHQYKLGGVISDARSTIQTTLDSICQGSGLTWAPSLQSIAVPWPGSYEDSLLALHKSKIDNVNYEVDSNDIITELRVLYDLNYAFNEHDGVLELRAKEAFDEYGGFGKTLELSWVKSAREALELGTRYLEYYSRQIWKFSCRMDAVEVDLAKTAAVDYPIFPAEEILITEMEANPALTSIKGEAPVGPVNSIVKIYDSNRMDAAPAEEFEYETVNGTTSVLITDEDKNPLPGAKVTIDDTVAKIAGPDGYIFIDADPGEHTLLIQYPGLSDQTMSIFI